MAIQLLAAGLSLCTAAERRGTYLSADGLLQFNVWAPHAPKCVVKCNGQNTQLNKTGDFWKGAVAGCGAGSQYVLNFGDVFDRIDYLAQDINDFGNVSVVPHPHSFKSKPVFIDKSKVVIYELHVPTFTASGTFDEAATKLPFLADLGVTVLELMPVYYFCGNPQSWGYNPCSPWAINAQMGGSAGLKRFIDAANQNGLGVVLDVVYNHMDGGTQLTNYGGDQFFFTDSRRDTPWGPRPNFDDDYVRNEYIIGNTKVLYEEYHISGLRWDSTICMRQGGGSGHCWDQDAPKIANGWKTLQDGNAYAHSGWHQNAFTVAEDNENFGKITRPQSDNGAGFDAQWGYIWFYEVVGQLTQPLTSSVDMGKVAASCSFDDGADPNSVVFTENHDQASQQNPGRIPHRVQPKDGPPDFWTQKKTMLGIGMVLSCRGFPMLLQGQEYLEARTFLYPVPPKIDWNQMTSSPFVREVRDMLWLRTNRNGTSGGLLGGYNSGGKTLLVSDTETDKVAVIHRWGPGGDALVILNFNDKYYKDYGLKFVPYDGRWTKRFDGDRKEYSELYNGACDWSQWADISDGNGPICIPKLSMIILTRD
eukprot:TRINITY_DN14552_c0_g1_i1.p1 TRINITY_DN14552_c0_g1~~TRINITY_DN14552_c0_g1_i1.p1  ORF type:complete len:617 (+),score=147.59 TRINITY_DN14552_c0_g1_i1:83-1852(+)